jgi:carbamoyltransferase
MPRTVVLGVNSAYHESSAALLVDGRIIAAVEEERWNQVKHGKSARTDGAHELPWRSIAFCLARAGIAGGDVTHVAYSFDPHLRHRLHLENRPSAEEAAAIPAGDFGSPAGEDAFLASNLEARRLLEERFPGARFHFVEHHLCHAASAYTVAPVEEAAILTVDGIGELHSTWLGLGRAGRIEERRRIAYPHSLGFLWERMSELLGFDVYGGPGKLMGYGAITDATGELSSRDHLATMREIAHPTRDGSFEIDNRVTRFRTQDFSELERRFGPRRRVPVDRYEDASIAAALQGVTEEILVHLARSLHAELSSGGAAPSCLCMAGGVALNCVANSRILRETPFTELWVQPAANDAGTALGAAAYLHAQTLGLPGRPRMDHAFLGPSFAEDEVASALARAGLTASRPDDPAAEVARRIERGEIVAWFQGALEFGPRALGHRSILADPTRFDTRNRINTQVKMRESFRPFAPSVLERATPDYFDAPPGAHGLDYMLMALPLRDDKVAQILPAVVQENASTHRSTARIHRVRKATDPLYHAVIEEFARLTGVGAVLNTSFNVGEPIVATPEQAIATFRRSKMDALLLGPLLVERAR